MANNQFVALSVLGTDRPGIVAAVTGVLYETGCNIEDSSMTLMRGEFAMILLVSLPAKLSHATLQRKLTPVLKRMALTLMLRPLSSRERVAQPACGRQFILTVYGGDKPGIVFTVSKYLATIKANITDVQTNVLSTPNGPTYLMLIEVALPAGLKAAAFKRDLASLGSSLGVTISANPVETPSM